MPGFEECMLCEPCTLEEARALLKAEPDNWIIQEKVDGVRGIIRGGKLYDRRGKDITAQFPEFAGIERLNVEYDGEIVCTSGEFGDVAGRMHVKDAFARKLLAKKNPAMFVLFDVMLVPVGVPGMHSWVVRRSRLEMIDECGVFEFGHGEKVPWMRVLPYAEASEFEREWAKVLADGKEGLVLKRKDSIYECKRSKSWRKVKAFIEGTATFIKAVPHPRGIRLETADGRAITVNGEQANEVLKALKAHGSVTCDIQYMRSPVKDSAAWRFPSYRGLRCDR